MFDQQGCIACHHFQKTSGYEEIYTLMRETMEIDETPFMTLKRGLMEEFAAQAEPVAFLGALSGPLPAEGVLLACCKTTLYFACQLIEWSPNLGNLADREGSSQIEWMKPQELISIMKRQAAQFPYRVDLDESEMITRALPYLSTPDVVV